MKAFEWAAKFRKCADSEQRAEVLDEFIDETLALYHKRKNESAIREQKQKWAAMRLYPPEVLDVALRLTCSKKSPTDKEIINFIRELEK